jgi:hypothetical protein
MALMQAVALGLGVDLLVPGAPPPRVSLAETKYRFGCGYQKPPAEERLSISADVPFVFSCDGCDYVAMPVGAGRWRVDMPAETESPFHCSYPKGPANDRN